jgi:hypothetical protein
MTILQLKAAVEEGNDFYFTYNNINAGIESTVICSEAVYDVWYGDAEKHYKNLDEVMNDKFYGNKSITELLLAGDIDIYFA